MRVRVKKGEERECDNWHESKRVKKKEEDYVKKKEIEIEITYLNFYERRRERMW